MFYLPKYIHGKGSDEKSILCAIRYKSTATFDTHNITGLTYAWQYAGSGIECDESAGEVYLRSLSGKVWGLDHCKKLCESTPACQSITYFVSGWCSHFSTLCSKTKRNKKALVRFLAKKGKIITYVDSTSTAHPDTTVAKATADAVTNSARQWQSMGLHTVCDTSSGEMYLESSQGEIQSLDECKNSCESSTGCQSITYFASRWCSHYGTPCTKTRSQHGAAAASISTQTAAATVDTTNTATNTLIQTMTKREGKATTRTLWITAR